MILVSYLALASIAIVKYCRHSFVHFEFLYLPILLDLTPSRLLLQLELPKWIRNPSLEVSRPLDQYYSL
jgi:hypothetical protein